MALWDWKIEDNDDTHFNIKMIFSVKDNLIKTLFVKGMAKVNKKLGKNIETDPHLITKIEIPDMYKPQLKMFIEKPYKITCKDIERDNQKQFKLLKNKENYEITRAVYKKEGHIWKIHISVKGEFIHA